LCNAPHQRGADPSVSVGHELPLAVTFQLKG
jgi:hypothetical protein